MSWSISLVGTKAAVALRIQELPLYGPPEQDLQVESAKRLIFEELRELPDDVNGVQVTASGHVMPGSARGRTLKVEVIPIDVLV